MLERMGSKLGIFRSSKEPPPEDKETGQSGEEDEGEEVMDKATLKEQKRLAKHLR